MVILLLRVEIKMCTNLLYLIKDCIKEKIITLLLKVPLGFKITMSKETAKLKGYKKFRFLVLLQIK